jgi:hypothetical protein
MPAGVGFLALCSVRVRHVLAAALTEGSVALPAAVHLTEYALDIAALEFGLGKSTWQIRLRFETEMPTRG